MSTDPKADASKLERELAAGKWTVVASVFEGEAILLGGVNPWEHKWESLKANVELPHPLYPDQRHALHIYRIDAGDRAIIFAAGELSTNVWGFYVPATWWKPFVTCAQGQ